MQSNIYRKKYLVLTPAFPPDAGGLSEYIYNFSKNIDADITVLSYKIGRNNCNGIKSYKHLEKFSIRRILYLSIFPWLTNLAVLTISVLLHFRKRFDLVICNHIVLGRVSLFLKKVFKLDYYLIAHGWEVADGGMYSGKYISIIREAKKIIVNSNFTKEEILKQCPRTTNIKITPPMINDELVCAASPEVDFKRRINLEGKKVLLTVSRLELTAGRKGHDLVMMSLPDILKKHPDVVYLIVGNGDARDNLKELAKHLGIAEKVIFHDYDRANIHNYYNICDVFIMPSRQIKRGGSVEGFGIVYLEAALFGKPSIGGRSGGISDAIVDGKTGLLVNPSDVSEISGAVIKLLDDPEYAKKLGLEAKRRALNEFSGERIGVEIEKLFAK